MRNMLKQKELSNELNVLVSWPLSECKRRLIQGGHISVTVGTKHNSLLIPLKGRGKSGVIEIATFRHRQDHPPTVDEDLLQRDLTINAIAYAWPDGPLIDPFNGYKDLTEGRIRFVRGLSTLEEDSLRALRLFRFTLQLEGDPEDADINAAEKTLTTTVPREKLRAELDRIFSLSLNGPKKQALIRRFFNSPLAQDIFVDMARTPICDAGETLAQRWDRAIGMILEMTNPDKEEDIPLLDLRWAAVFHEMGELSCIALKKGSDRSAHYNIASQKIGEIIKKFRFSQRRQRRILNLLRHFDINSVPTDRALLRMMKNDTPIEGLFRLVHSRGVSNIKESDGMGDWGKSKNKTAISAKSKLNGKSNALVEKLPAVKNLPIKSMLDDQLAKVLERCRSLQRASCQPSPRDLDISGWEILDLVRRPQGAWMGEIINELLEWIMHNPSRNQRCQLQDKVREWVSRQ